MIILGLDYGTKHTGVAILDTTIGIADPLTNIKTEKLIPFLQKLIQERDIELIVVGLPSGPLHNIVLNLKTTLSQHTSLPVIFHPETLSTQEALSKLRTIKAKKRKLKHEHMFSACLILEDFILSHPNGILDKN